VSKRSVSAAASELQIPERTWQPAKTGRGPVSPVIALGILVALAVVWAWEPLTTVVRRSLNTGEYEHYSHIVLLPFFSAYLLYLNRQAILQRARRAVVPGVVVIAAGALAVGIGTFGMASEPDLRLSLAMAGLVLLWAGSFIACLGMPAFGAAAFPFFMLVFMIPLPPAMLQAIVVFLQHASADASDVVFGLIGMPHFREGTVFALPGLTIHVAEECSGIRSSLALVISGFAMSYLLLRRTWTRTALILAIVPIAIVKNAVRIVALSWLAVYVDPSFITGSFVHRSGGIPIFVLALTMLGTVLFALRRFEGRDAA
jgi:exosortase